MSSKAGLARLPRWYQQNTVILKLPYKECTEETLKNIEKCCLCKLVHLILFKVILSLVCSFALG